MCRSINLAIFVLGVFKVALVDLVVHFRSTSLEIVLFGLSNCSFLGSFRNSLLRLLSLCSFGCLERFNAFTFGRSHHCFCFCIRISYLWLWFGRGSLLLFLLLQHFAPVDFEDELHSREFTLEWERYLRSCSVMSEKLCRCLYSSTGLVVCSATWMNNEVLLWCGRCFCWTHQPWMHTPRKPTDSAAESLPPQCESKSGKACPRAIMAQTKLTRRPSPRTNYECHSRPWEPNWPATRRTALPLRWWARSRDCRTCRWEPWWWGSICRWEQEWEDPRKDRFVNRGQGWLQFRNKFLTCPWWCSSDWKEYRGPTSSSSPHLCLPPLS